MTERPRRAGDSPGTASHRASAPVHETDDTTHRGGFGTHGGESGAFIERTFREQIVLVGVSLGGADPDPHRRRSGRVGSAHRHRRGRRGGPGVPAPLGPRSGHLHRGGQGQRGAGPVRTARRRHRGVRRRAEPGPAVQPGEAPGPHRHRPHRGDPGTSSPRTPAARRARPRWSWPNSAIGCPDCAGAKGSASRRAGSAPGDRGRPSWRWTAAASSAASTSWRPSFAPSPRTARCRAAAADAPPSTPWPSSATPTRVSPGSSTG